MTTRVVLTPAQRAAVRAGHFVRVGLAHARGSALVGRVEGVWRAYYNECRHRALPLDLGASSPMADDGAHLLCHQHGALYRLSDGVCVLGPCAGERLCALEVAEIEGELVLGPATDAMETNAPD
jgi:nitrite reductase/ring-hydroxylating ferredoxin subunit